MPSQILAVLLVGLAAIAPLAAEDSVTYLGRDGKMLRRTGTIENYSGAGLVLTLANGRQETIEVEKVLTLQTPSTAEETAGDALLAENKIADATTAFEKAKRSETRQWVVRRIRAKLIDCYERLKKLDVAGDEFLAIVAEDSETPYLAVAPFAWRTSDAPPLRAAAWLAAREPAAQLLGASWLLASPERAAAIKVLKSLSSDLDPHIAHLATAQLWRTTVVTVTQAEAARWQQQVERMPANLRGGPTLIVGDALARLNSSDDALLAYLQTPLVYSERKVLAREGYVSAAQLLKKLGRAEDAARILREAEP